MQRYLRWFPALCCGTVLIFCSGCARARNATVAARPDPWRQLRSLYDYDTKQLLNVKILDERESFVATTRRLTLRGARGATVPAYVIVPATASASRKAPGVVLLHGKDGRAEDMLVIGQLLATRGYASLIPEYVGHGARRGQSNAAPMFSGKAGPLRAGIIESVQDVRRALDVFVTQPEVDARRVGLVGLSLGAIMGSITTAVEPRLATCVLIVGGADWRVMLGQSQESDARRTRESGAATAAELALLEAIDPKNFIGHVAPRPVLMLNGRRDTIIPPAAARALFAAAASPKKQIWFDAGHSLPPPQVAPFLEQWLDRELKAVRRAAPPQAAPPQASPPQASPPQASPPQASPPQASPAQATPRPAA